MFSFKLKLIFLTKALCFPSNLSTLLLPSDTASEGGEQPPLSPHSGEGPVEGWCSGLAEMQLLRGKVIAFCDEWFAGNLENCALYSYRIAEQCPGK